MSRQNSSHDKQAALVEAQVERTSPHLTDIIKRNVETIAQIRAKRTASRSPQQIVSDVITAFTGSMLFVYIHAALFGLWIILNVGFFGIKPFDPFPFGLLTMIVSLEAIFLSTFVLVSQNRMAYESDQRAQLDLQINLLAEYEVTRVLKLVDQIAEKLGIATDDEAKQLEADVEPDNVVRDIEGAETANSESSPNA